MNTTSSPTKHEEVNERLPWYVNGTLPEDERAAVAAHLEVCTVCRDDLALNEALARAVRRDGAVPIPPAAKADELLREVAGRDRRRLADWRMAAAIGVIAVAGALLLLRPGTEEPPNQRFTTTTQDSTLATVDYVFQLRFEAGVDDATRARILGELGGAAQVLDAGMQDYRVTLPLPPQSLADLEERAAEIAARREVASAGVVALQVPVR